MLKISFYGGAQEVTGANYLIETDTTRLLVDCGMFQGTRFCVEKNRNDFTYDPASIDALLVTHAHIDHVGRIPRLVEKGFKGHIYSTSPTRDFAALMLEDSLGVLEKEALHEKEKDALYTTADIEQAMALWKGVPYKEQFSVGDCTIRLYNSGHILGSALIEIDAGGKKMLFTGDVGNVPMPLLNPPDHVDGVEIMVIESAYGNRVHEGVDEREEMLERAIEDVVQRGGTLMIPAFALERTQELIFACNDLVEKGRIPAVPIFIDSPLAIRATEIYKRYESYFSAGVKEIIRNGDDIFKFPGLHLTLHTEDSKAINTVEGPKVIFAGAGMMTGGRILHHARRYLSDPKNMILFIGYQAAGSLGRRILDGERRVRIFGDDVSVRAEMRSIRAYSAHADTNELFNFVESNVETLERVFVVQGEPAAALFLAQRVRDYLGIDARAPEFGDTVSF